MYTYNGESVTDLLKKEGYCIASSEENGFTWVYIDEDEERTSLWVKAVESE